MRGVGGSHDGNTVADQANVGQIPRVLGRTGDVSCQRRIIPDSTALPGSW